MSIFKVTKNNGSTTILVELIIYAEVLTALPVEPAPIFSGAFIIVISNHEIEEFPVGDKLSGNDFFMDQ